MMKSLVFKYNSYYFLSNLVFQKGIFMLFLTTQRGIDNAEIAILQLSLLVGMFLSEVPTGILGDRFGRKFSVVTGLILLTSSSLGFIVFENFWVLAILFFLEGLGMSFISGSDQSLLYDNLKQMNEEDQFLKTMSTSLGLSYISLAIASVIGGLIQEVSWNLVYGLSSIAILGSILFFVSIKELSFNQSESIDLLTKKVITQKKSIIDETAEYFKSYEGRKILQVFILLGAFEATCMAYFMFSQQFFHMLGLNVFVISLVFMAGRLLSGFSYFIAPKLAKKFSSRKVIISTMLGTSLFLVLNVFDFSFYYYVSFAAIVILPYISNVLNVNFIHSKIPSLTRASIMSVGSMIGSVSLGLAYLIIGFLLDATTLNITTTAIGIINLATALLYVIKTKSMEWGQTNDKAA